MFRKNQKNLAYLLVLVIPFLIFFARSDAFTGLKFGFIHGMGAPIRLLSIPIYEVKKVLFYHKTFREYQRLKKQVDILKARLVGLEEVMQENARLEKLLGLKQELVYASVAAHVIGRDPSLWNSALIIDKGTDDGITQGMAVVNALGVVGKIAETSPETSKVILLTDPQFSVAAVVGGSREVGLVSGSLQMDVCRIRYLSAQAKVYAGDKVITSKLSSSFPEGLLIGEVIEVIDYPQRPSIECIIKPVVSFSQVEEVLILLK
ncbi:MAG: rod shape-determining protein MreC [Omnitrophica WOR_2 bacterium RIFCSPHIGHO2_02_FULL_50_17]|nr:MAG: rod shape-determining protein MreC [Omnitrophica WOR_2 bacterium RIFCSPHIGHO2_02_FULL_50_17]